MSEAQRVSGSSEIAQVKKKAKFFGVDGRLKTIGRSLAQKHDVNIEFGAGNPSTDGRNVYLPHLKPGVTNQEMDTFVGYIHHEVAHCNHSDMENDGVERTVGKLQGKYSKNYNFDTIKYLTNAVEDVRIEHLNMDDSPGSVDYFRTMYKDSINKKVNDYKPSDTIENAVTDVIMDQLSSHHNEEAKEDNLLRDKMKLNPHFGPMTKKLEPVFKKVIKDRKNPKALEQCTKELMRRVANYMEQKNEDDPDLGDEAVQDAMDKLGEHINNGNSSTASNGPNGMQSGHDQAKDKFMDQNGENAAQEQDGLGMDPGEGSSGLRPFGLDPEDRKVAKKNAPKVRQSLVQAMQAHKNKLTRLYQDQGIFDVKKAHRFTVMGKTNVFKNTQKFKKIFTACDLAIDVSGSMGGGWGSGRGNMYEARKIAIAMDLATRGTDIRLGMSLFDWEYYRLKQFNQPLTDDMIKMIGANGGTNLAKAVYTSSKYISALPEERKIVIAVTDGGVSDDIMPVDALCRNAGIEIYYILVGDSPQDAERSLKQCPIDKKYCAAFGGDFSKQFMNTFRDLILNGSIKHDL